MWSNEMVFYALFKNTIKTDLIHGFGALKQKRLTLDSLSYFLGVLIDRFLCRFVCTLIPCNWYAN